MCGPRLHATLDIVVALAVAAAPILPALRPDVTGIAVVEVAALAWIRLGTLTRYTRLTPQSLEPGPLETGLVEPRSPDAGPADAGRAEPPALPLTGVVVARGLGMLAGRSARRLPEAEEKLRGGVRQAGRHAGRLQRTWRKPPT